MKIEERESLNKIESQLWIHIYCQYDGKRRKIYRKRDKRNDIEDENRGKRELE